jgi:hypothetical protein
MFRDRLRYPRETLKQALVIAFTVWITACGGDDGLGGVEDPPNNNTMSTTHNGRNPSTTMSVS